MRLILEDEKLQITEVPYLTLAADVDRTLTSPAFGLSSTYSPNTEKKIQRYHQLSRKKVSLENAEKEEYEQLQLFMSEVQPFNTLPEPNSLEARIDDFLKEHLS